MNDETRAELVHEVNKIISDNDYHIQKMDTEKASVPIVDMFARLFADRAVPEPDADMECKLTQRGFEYYEFTDRYGEKCSLQKSSLATGDAIWMGVNDLGLKGMRYGQGWTPISEEEVADVFGYQMVQGNKRMHLTRDQVARLLPILQRFVDTGEIGERQAAAGDDLDADWLDELLDSVHPECGIRDLTVLPGIPASAVIIYPTEYDAKGRWAEYETYGGTGATRTEALAAAVRQAKGTEGSE